MMLTGMAMLLLSAVATMVGLLWLGQGSGYFPFPHGSFMISDPAWAWRGGVVAAIGVGLMAGSRRVG